MRWLPIFLLLVACSDPEPPPTVEPEPEPATEPEPEAEAEREPVTALELPDVFPELTNLPTEERRVESSEEYVEDLVFEVVMHPNDEIRETLAAVIAGLAAETRRSRYLGAECGVPFAHDELVQVACDAPYEIRGGEGLVTTVVTWAVVDGRLEPVDLRDSFLPGTDLQATLIERCEVARQAAIEGLDEDDYGHPDYWQTAAECVERDLAITMRPEGILGSFHYSWEVMETSIADIPWAELRDQIRADGPLAAVLSDRTWRPTEPTESEANGFAISEFATESTLVDRWARLEDAAGVGVDRFGGGLGRLVVAGSDEVLAARLASALDAEPRPVRLDAVTGRAGQWTWGRYDEAEQVVRARSAPLRWVRTTADLNLRPTGTHRADGEVIGVVPRGALLPAIGGALGEAGSWIDTHTPLGPGVIAARRVREHEECVPAAARSEEPPLVAKVRSRRAGSATDAWLIVDVDAGRVELRAASGDCEVGDEILAFEVEGRLFDVRMTGTTENGGSSIVVAGSRVRDTEGLRYVAHRVGSSGPVLEETVTVEPRFAARVVRVSESADGTYFPVTIANGRDVRRFTWSDDALTEQVPEASP